MKEHILATFWRGYEQYRANILRRTPPMLLESRLPESKIMLGRHLFILVLSYHLTNFFFAKLLRSIAGVLLLQGGRDYSLASGEKRKSLHECLR